MDRLSITALVDTVVEESRKPRIVNREQVVEQITERVRAVDNRFHLYYGQKRSVPGGTVLPLCVSLEGNFLTSFDVVESLDPGEIDPVIGRDSLEAPSQEQIESALRVGLERYAKQVRLRRLGNNVSV